MGMLVPVEDMTQDALRAVTPGSATWQRLATEVEGREGLPAGALTGAKFNLKPGTHPLEMLNAVAADMKRNPSPLGADAIPRSPGERAPLAAPPNPAEGGGTLQVGPFDTGIKTPEWVDQTLAGAGKSLADTGRGLGQLAGVVPQSEVDEAARLDKPLMGTTAGTLGYVGGTAAQAALPGGLASKVLTKAAPATVLAAPKLASVVNAAASPVGRGAATGAAYNTTQPVLSGDTRAGNAVEGGVFGGLGAALGSGVQRLGTAAADYARPGIADLARRAEALGIPLRAAQISDNPFLKWATGGLDMLPFSGAKALTAEQQAAFNTALSRTVGEDTPDALKALQNARARMNKTYADVKERNTLQLEPWHVDAMQDTAKGFRRLDVSTGKADSNQLDALTKAIVNNTDDNGVITGEVYKSLRSKIGSLESEAKDTDYKAALNNYKTVLDKAFKSGLSTEDAAALQLTDRQWANLKTLENIAPKTADGDFDFNKLSTVLRGKARANSSNRNASIYGTGNTDVSELADIGTTFLNRGVQGSPAGPGDYLSRIGKAAVTPVGTGAVIGGMSYLNHEDPHPFTKSAAELGALAFLASMASKGANSRWLAQGSPGLVRAGRALSGAGQAPVGALNAFKQQVGPTSEELGQ